MCITLALLTLTSTIHEESFNHIHHDIITLTIFFFTRFLNSILSQKELITKCTAAFEFTYRYNPKIEDCNFLQYLNCLYNVYFSIVRFVCVCELDAEDNPKFFTL